MFIKSFHIEQSSSQKIKKRFNKGLSDIQNSITFADEAADEEVNGLQL